MSDTKKAILAIWDVLYGLVSQAQNYSDSLNEDLERAYAKIQEMD